MKEPLKFCKNCKWSAPDKGHPNDINFLLCSNPKNEIIDMVTGKRTPNWGFCNISRSIPDVWAFLNNECGKSGRWFETKDKQ